MNAALPLAALRDDVRILDSLDDLARDAAGALDRAAQPGFYDRHDWLALTHAHIYPGEPLAIAAVHEPTASAWLPLRDCGAGHGRALASWYTLAFAPLFTPDADAEAQARLLGEAARLLRRRFDTLSLWPLEAETAAQIQHAFRAQGWLAAQHVEAANWVADTAGLDFEAYWANRPSKLRNTVRRRTKNSPFTTQVLDRFDDAAWDAYEAVYAQSWKPDEGAPAFLRAAAAQEGAAGTLRLGIARRDGVPVAAQFWTVENGTATIHKLAYLESEREHSPGTLLSVAMFRHVLDQDRPVVIDYGNGDEPYKAEWMDRRRKRYRLRLYNLRSIGGLSQGAARAARAVLRRITR
ncbi:GNAT family N-acetyltransferase [Sphingomonas sp. BT-65]|uniref:GNAT family N-acetyltransferase n=1 Tax=Sphingomonas sp. BT-65 TaxID=2989821 RepID=UPI002235CC7A|nr:GNAT family N-acetyltransferase [Sphingomonas sp. BT-65]MCW4461622.1 GNAT family N-acetyltransferase [Sphingomonas sp. BT-65]